MNFEMPGDAGVWWLARHQETTADCVYQLAEGLEETTRHRGVHLGWVAVADFQLQREPQGTHAQETRGMEKADRAPSPIEALGCHQFVAPLSTYAVWSIRHLYCSMKFTATVCLKPMI